MKELRSKIREALLSALPITAIVYLLAMSPLLSFTRAELVTFTVSAVLLVLGIGVFNLGADLAMTPMGTYIGAGLSKQRKLGLLLSVCFVLGVLITVAEPDLLVLATQVSAVMNGTVLIYAVGIGVGGFLIAAVLRIVFRRELSTLLMLFYMLLFALSLLLAAGEKMNLLPLAFDSGGVTTGPITVPFLMALCVGISGVLGDRKSQENSFGMVAICSIGPILMMLLLCAFTRPEVNTAISHNSSSNFSELVQSYLTTAGAQFKEVLIALTPITVIFFIFNFASFRLPAIQLFRILFGFLYTYIGLSIFLTGVNAAYMGTGYFIGQSLASSDKKWMLMPIGAVVATFIILAEPAVGVLTKQVEEISAGAIKKHTILIALALSMAFALAFSMFRILYGISIWWVLGIGYAVALGMSFLVPRVFTSIAFDSGGVASGPMTATFLLPFAIGAAEQIQGADGILTSAYGLVATVALMPLITIQFIGLLSQLKQKRFNKKRLKVIDDDEIIELNVN